MTPRVKKPTKEDEKWADNFVLGTIMFFILLCVGSIPFGYDPPRVLMLIVWAPLFIAIAIGCVVAFVGLILSLLR
jgi:hypothetical protein